MQGANYHSGWLGWVEFTLLRSVWELPSSFPNPVGSSESSDPSPTINQPDTELWHLPGSLYIAPQPCLKSAAAQWYSFAGQVRQTALEVVSFKHLFQYGQRDMTSDAHNASTGRATARTHRRVSYLTQLMAKNNWREIERQRRSA